MYMLVEKSSGSVVWSGGSVSSMINECDVFKGGDKVKISKAIHKQLAPDSRHKTILGGRYVVNRFEGGEKRVHSLLSADINRLIDLERIVFSDEKLTNEVSIISYLESKGVTPSFSMMSARYMVDIKSKDKSGDYDFVHSDYRRLYLGSRSYFSDRVDSGVVYIEIGKMFTDSTKHTISVLKEDVLPNCNAYNLFIDTRDDTLYIQSLHSNKSGGDIKGKEIYLENVVSSHFGGRVYSLEDATLRLTLESERQKAILSRQAKRISDLESESVVFKERIEVLSVDNKKFEIKIVELDKRINTMNEELEAFKELFKEIVENMPKEEADKLREKYAKKLEDKKKPF